MNEKKEEAREPSILLILPDLAGGGAERTSLNVRNHLRARGRSIELALLEARGEYLDLVSPEDYVLPPGRMLRALARWLPADSPQRALAQVPLLMGLLRRQRPDVVMSSMADITLPLAVAFVLMPGRRRATRWIAREGNHTRVVMERAFPDAKLRRWIEGLIRWAYRSADVCLVTSRGVGNGLVESYAVDPDRIRVIGNPVDLDKVRAGTVETPPITLPKRFVLGVGRLAYQKGFDLLIEAVSKMNAPDVDLVLAGTGPDEAALRERAEGLGLGNRVHFPGFVEHPSALMARAEIFCLSSRWEGFGHVIVEAMASGSPVLVTDCEFGPGEIVSHGKNGVVVPPENSAALAAALTDLLESPDEAQRLAGRALERASEFGADRIAEAYREVFDEYETPSQ